jgi:hypothetical protein
VANLATLRLIFESRRSAAGFVAPQIIEIFRQAPNGRGGDEAAENDEQSPSASMRLVGHCFLLAVKPQKPYRKGSCKPMSQTPRLKHLNLRGEETGKIAANAVKMAADRRLTEAGGYTKI